MPIDVIRREAELARDATSLRQVAREIGITPMGLRYFLMNQGKPYAPTVRKLNEWYARRMAGRAEADEAAGHQVRAALTILASQYPERDRADVMAQVIDALERGFVATQMPVPGWVHTLRGEWAGAAG